MRPIWYLPMVVLAGSAGFHDRAFAGGPVVIPGIGPDVQYQAQPAPRAYQQQSELGGGFLEMLVTGRDPTAGQYARPAAPPMVRAAPVLAQPPVARVAYAPAAAAPMMAMQQAMNPMFRRQEVDYAGTEKAGTIVVDTPSRFLYYVLGNGRALRYGIGVGRPGFEWAGVKTVSRKAEWPGWTPPPEMLLRRPDLPRHMEGGPDNPLGARALYLGSSMYRIHGTNEPHTIGQNVSSGCIRMMNEDVIDLYERARVGTRVIVI